MIGSLFARFWGYLVVAGVIAVLGWYLVQTIEGKALAEEAVDTYKAALSAQNDRIAEYDAKLRIREKARQRASQEAAAWKKRWEDDQTAPEVKEWADTALPDIVRDRLRELAGEAGSSDPDREPLEQPDPIATLF
jgi:transketolase